MIFFIRMMPVPFLTLNCLTLSSLRPLASYRVLEAPYSSHSSINAGMITFRIGIKICLLNLFHYMPKKLRFQNIYKLIKPSVIFLAFLINLLASSNFLYSLLQNLLNSLGFYSLKAVMEILRFIEPIELIQWLIVLLA